MLASAWGISVSLVRIGGLKWSSTWVLRPACRFGSSLRAAISVYLSPPMLEMKLASREGIPPFFTVLQTAVWWPCASTSANGTENEIAVS